ncbi:MAG: DUF695 domain-containing protein [Myxococcales bacterium]|nr:DUF695 domain-containing protein [Myxococcales bacterium]
MVVWAANKDALAEAIADGTLSKWTERISEQVHRVHPKLAWEFGAGRDSEHYFCVSCEGDIELRIEAERWLMGAPARDATWEYHAAKPGGSVSGFRIGLEDIELDAESLRIGVDKDAARARANVVVHHPAFADAAEGTRTFGAFLMLDTALGEDDVERWIGSIDTATEEPEGAIGLAELPGIIEELAAEPDAHTLFEGTTEDGRKVFSVVNVMLKRVDHLLLDSLVTIRIPLPPRDDGLTDATESDILNEHEDELCQRLGPNAVFVAHETGLGFRTIYLHASTTGPAPGIVDAWCRDHGEYDMEVETSHDPRWEILQRW